MNLQEMELETETNQVNLNLKQVPITKTGMLIRKPVADVFEAFINPDITTKFWFTKSSGRLEAGKQVQWEWEMYGISIPVTAKAIEPNKRILIEWPGYSGLTTVEWIFSPQEDGTTFVSYHRDRLHWRRGRACETGDRLDARVLLGARGPQSAPRA